MPSSQARRERRYNERVNFLDPTKRNPDTVDIYLYRWMTKLTALALTRRKWCGLPDGVDERYLEKLLLTQGCAIIHGRDDSPVAQSLSLEGAWDSQENQTMRGAYGADGSYERGLSELDSVIIYDNMSRVPLKSELYFYARDLAKHDMEIMRNVTLQNSFFLLSVPREMKSDGEKLMRNIGMGEAGMLVADGALNLIEPKTISTGVVPVMEKLNESKDHLYNEACSFLGIEYVPFEKKERLVTAEAEIASDIIDRQREFFLYEAREACEKMNQLFGWNVSVEWNTLESKSEMGVEENGDTNFDTNPE